MKRTRAWARELGMGIVVALLVVAAIVVLLRWRFPDAADAPRWLPLDAGNQWVYDLEERREVTVGDGRPRVSNITGAVRWMVRGEVPQFRGRAREVLESRTEGNAFTGILSDRAVGRALAVNRRGLTQLGDWSPPLKADTKVSVYDPPLLLLAFPPEPGRTWEVGQYEMDGRFSRVSAEVLGVEAVETPAGHFPECVKVRYTRTSSGTLPLRDRRAPIQEDLREETVWYALGVGRVKLTATERRRFPLPTGEVTTTVVEETQVLRRYSLAAPPATPPAQGAETYEGDDE